MVAITIPLAILGLIIYSYWIWNKCSLAFPFTIIFLIEIAWGTLSIIWIDRIKVIHQVNRGCSVARNEGLSHAKGEYIGIIDQDDYLHEKYIEYFMKLMLDHNAEIATTDTILPFIGDAPVSTNLDFNKYSILSGEDAAKAMLMYTLQIGPWNKLIKKALIEREGIYFQEQFYCGEGFAFSVECFQSTNKVVVGHQNVYFYRIDNATSGSSTFSLGKYNSSVNAQDYMRNVLKDKSQ